MKFDNQLRYASSIIASYKGEIPLHAWLKDFFRGHKQMGSRDRKLLGNLVYGFYRLGHTVKNMPIEERLILGLFLCNNTPGEFLQYFRPDWNEHAGRSLEEKITLVSEAAGSGIGFRVTDIFPWKEELSEGIDHFAFCLSFLRQPDLFLRIRPRYEKEVLEKLSGRPHEFIPPSTVRLPNGFRIEELFTPDKEIVIQDYSSQRIAPFLQLPPPLSFWDACAASGGKSILAFDLNPGITITVSDIRESILRNLRQRFRQAGIRNYRSFVADLSDSGSTGLTDPDTLTGQDPLADPNPPADPSSGDLVKAGPGPIGGPREPGDPVPAKGTGPATLIPPQDLILTDVPCTGSGTWGRTPEELYFFDPAKIGRYNEWQKKIVLHTIPHLAKDACFVYSTCSVFKKENEEMVDFIGQSSGLRPDRVEQIKGYGEKADSMFAARLLN